MVNRINRLALLCAGTLIATSSFAIEDQSITNGPPTTRLWAFSASVEQFRLHGDRGNDVFGKAGQVGFGLGVFVNDRWLVQGLVNLHAGPWERIRDSSFNADFSGTGVTVESIVGLTGPTLRSGGGVWSAVLSAEYLDLVGRTIGPNLKEPTTPQAHSDYFFEQSYQININAIWLNPGIEWTNIKTPRPSGNSTELLTTRVEGCSLRLSAGFPIYSSYRANSVGRDNSGAPVATQAAQENVDKGRLRGYSVITSVHTWLGS